MRCFHKGVLGLVLVLLLHCGVTVANASYEQNGRKLDHESAAVVTLDSASSTVPLLAEAADEASILATCKNGETVFSIDTMGAYTRVRAGFIEGYLPTKCLMYTDSLTSLVSLVSVQAETSASSPLSYGEGGWAAFYTSPSFYATRVQVYDSFCYKVLDVVGTWYYVKDYGRDIVGYIPTSYGLAYAPMPMDGRKIGIVHNPEPQDRLHLRENPSSVSESLGRYFSGTQVEILGETSGYYAVRVDGQEGYMSADFVYMVDENMPWWLDDSDPNG